MSAQFAVKARKAGSVFTLRRGFTTRDAAEDHPVVLALWDEVWVAEEPTKIPSPPSDTLPPLPWDWEAHPAANHIFHTYIVDAHGKKIAAMCGSGEARRLTAERIVASVNGTAPDEEPTA